MQQGGENRACWERNIKKNSSCGCQPPKGPLLGTQIFHSRFIQEVFGDGGRGPTWSLEEGEETKEVTVWAFQKCILWLGRIYKWRLQGYLASPIFSPGLDPVLSELQVLQIKAKDDKYLNSQCGRTNKTLWELAPASSPTSSCPNSSLLLGLCTFCSFPPECSSSD